MHSEVNGFRLTCPFDNKAWKIPLSHFTCSVVGIFAVPSHLWKWTAGRGPNVKLRITFLLFSRISPTASSLSLKYISLYLLVQDCSGYTCCWKCFGFLGSCHCCCSFCRTNTRVLQLKSVTAAEQAEAGLRSFYVVYRCVLTLVVILTVRGRRNIVPIMTNSIYYFV